MTECQTYAMRNPALICMAALFACSPLNAGDQIPPADSEMAKLPGSPFGVLDNAAGIKTSGYHMESVGVAAFDPAKLPAGVGAGLKFTSVAQQAGGKGDCTVAKTVDSSFKMLGGWFYISPETQVQRLGIQIQETGGEYFLLTFPGDFTGWKWLEGKREDLAPMIPAEKSGFDGVLDQSVTRVSIVWFTKDQNPAEIGVAGLMQAVQ